MGPPNQALPRLGNPNRPPLQGLQDPCPGLIVCWGVGMVKNSGLAGVIWT